MTRYITADVPTSSDPTSRRLADSATSSTVGVDRERRPLLSAQRLRWIRTERGRRLHAHWNRLQLQVGNELRRDTLILAQRGRISRSQIDPLYRDGSRVEQKRLFEFPFDDAFEDRPWQKVTFDLAIIQPWIDTPTSLLENLVNGIRDHRPNAKVVLFDSEAPSHLRHAAIGDRIDLYVKKHVLADWTSYESGVYDSTLAEFESQFDPAYRIKYRPGISRDWLKRRLFIGWNFAGDVGLLRLLGRRAYEATERPIDLHARLAAPKDVGAHWYNHMRMRSVNAVQRLTPAMNAIVETKRSPIAEYLAEMRKSKLCFSPFGYGEVCWRDFEAIACGAIVVKPDMSHLKTTPDLYRPFETYAPVRWDFSDLEEVCARLLSDHDLQREIRLNAVRIWRRYVDHEWTHHWTRMLDRMERE